MLVDMKRAEATGLICTREGNSLSLSIVSLRGKLATIDDDLSLLSALVAFGNPDICHVYERAIWKGEISKYIFNETSIRNLQSPRWSTNLICIGDSHAYFSPYHGQGMTSAVNQSKMLLE